MKLACKELIFITIKIIEMATDAAYCKTLDGFVS